MTLIEALRADAMERQKRLRSLTPQQREWYGERYPVLDYFAAHYAPRNGVDVMFTRAGNGQTRNECFWIIAGNTQDWLPNLAAVQLVLLFDLGIPYNQGWQPRISILR